MITVQRIKDAKPHDILENARCIVNGQLFRYVAVRGGAEDWAVYRLPIPALGDVSANEVALNGDKWYPWQKDFPVIASKEAKELYRA